MKKLIEFDKWFKAVEAGNNNEWVEPEYNSQEWHEYISRRSLALGAWNASTIRLRSKIYDLEQRLEGKLSRSDIPDTDTTTMLCAPPASAVPGEIDRDNVPFRYSGPMQWEPYVAGWKDYRTAILTQQQINAICTCPSGDGSLRWPCPVHPPADYPISSAIRDVIAERQRQVDKGHTPASDDEYIDGVLALGGAAYAVSGAGMEHVSTYRQRAKRLWSFPCETFNPAGNANRRHDLVRGAAMIVAEIERIDRANGNKVEL